MLGSMALAFPLGAVGLGVDASRGYAIAGLVIAALTAAALFIPPIVLNALRH